MAKDLEKVLPGLTFEPRDAVLVGAPAGAQERLRGLKPVAIPGLAAGFAAAGAGPLQVVFSPPAALRRSLEEALPTLPRDLGGVSVKVFTRGVRWVALGADAPPKPALRLTVQATDAAAAKRLGALGERALTAIGRHRGLKDVLPGFDRLARALAPRVEKDRVLASLGGAELKSLLPLVIQVRAAAVREETAGKLQRIGTAMHEFHDKYNHFPPAVTTDAKKRRLLSWRVHLLPFLGEAALYKEFHLDEPWDSEHNKKLIKKMPKVFMSAANEKLARDGKTPFLAPIGLDTVFPGTKPVKFSEVLDGTANTIFLVEVEDARAVVWTKPEDLPLDPTDPAKGLRKQGGKVFVVLFVDGSAHFLPANMDKQNLYALFTRNGGEVVKVP